ncbi:uncharacterized protein LOC135473537 [Liolophura sinensis]|uniref:uncharacterized protein LOC135473537 n=1 Tax=Liolophura sinensis TaxID=3198878 RepID=UPI0031584173
MCCDYAWGQECDDVHPGLWVRDNNDCQIAYQCDYDGKISQQVKCNASQIWSKLASACVWEYDPERDDCNGQPMQPKENDDRCVKRTGNNPDPEDCSRFVSCANGTLIAIQKCGEGTLFFPKNDSCEFAQVVAKSCGSRPIPDHIVITEPDPECKGLGDSVIPDLSNSCYFHHCQAGKKIKRDRCPHGTAFRHEGGSGKCEWSKTRCGPREG